MIKRESKAQQGNVGLALAIAYFVAEGYTVSIPLNDCQKYDLIVENGKLNKVQVKTSAYKQNDSWRVELRTTSANTKTYTSRPFESNEVDILFIVCDDGTRYNIPMADFELKSSLLLGKKYDSYKV